MADYSNEQKEMITQMPAAVLLGAIISDPGGAIVGTREFLAGEKFISEAGQMYPRNGLIQYMLQNVDLPKLEEIVRPIFSKGSLEAMHSECATKVVNGRMALANDEEAQQFKSFLIALAKKVTSAVGEGFFGNKGKAVSANEAAYIEKLKQDLQIARTPSV